MKKIDNIPGVQSSSMVELGCALNEISAYLNEFTLLNDY